MRHWYAILLGLFALAAAALGAVVGFTDQLLRSGAQAVATTSGATVVLAGVAVLRRGVLEMTFGSGPGRRQVEVRGLPGRVVGVLALLALPVCLSGYYFGPEPGLSLLVLGWLLVCAYAFVFGREVPSWQPRTDRPPVPNFRDSLAWQVYIGAAFGWAIGFDLLGTAAEHAVTVREPPFDGLPEWPWPVHYLRWATGAAVTAALASLPLLARRRNRPPGG